ncbi:hypothetical protein ACLBXO_22800 [Methylobacterium sp. C33D]
MMRRLVGDALAEPARGRGAAIPDIVAACELAHCAGLFRERPGDTPEPGATPEIPDLRRTWFAMENGEALRAVADRASAEATRDRGAPRRRRPPSLRTVFARRWLPGEQRTVSAGGSRLKDVRTVIVASGASPADVAVRGCRRPGRPNRERIHARPKHPRSPEGGSWAFTWVGRRGVG